MKPGWVTLTPNVSDSDIRSLIHVQDQEWQDNGGRRPSGLRTISNHKYHTHTYRHQLILTAAKSALYTQYLHHRSWNINFIMTFYPNHGKHTCEMVKLTTTQDQIHLDSVTASVGFNGLAAVSWKLEPIIIPIYPLTSSSKTRVYCGEIAEAIKSQK